MKKNLNRKIIRRIILEEAAIIKKERKENFLLIKNHALLERKLLNSGMTLQESKRVVLNEFVESGGDAIKFMFINWLCDQLGFESDSFFGSVVKNTIENFSAEEFGKVLSGEQGICDVVTDNLGDGLIEAIGDSVLEMIGAGDVNEQGVLMSTMREIFTNFLRDAAVAQSLKNSIKDVVCSFSFGDLFSFASGDTSKSTSQGNSEASNLDNELGNLFNSLSKFIPNFS